MTITNRKSKGKAKASFCNVVGIFTRETEKDVASLFSSEKEESLFAPDTGASPTSKTQFGKQYLKQYGEVMVDSPQSAEETIEQSMKPSMKNRKNFVMSNLSRKVEWDHQLPPSTLFRSDVLA